MPCRIELPSCLSPGRALWFRDGASGRRDATASGTGIPSGWPLGGGNDP